MKEQLEELKKAFIKKFGKEYLNTGKHTFSNYAGQVEDVIKWIIENWPKEEVKQEPIGYLYKTEFGGTEFIGYKERKIYANLSNDEFTPVYTKPQEEKKEEYTGINPKQA